MHDIGLKKSLKLYKNGISFKGASKSQPTSADSMAFVTGVLNAMPVAVSRIYAY